MSEEKINGFGKSPNELSGKNDRQKAEFIIDNAKTIIRDISKSFPRSQLSESAISKVQAFLVLQVMNMCADMRDRLALLPPPVSDSFSLDMELPATPVAQVKLPAAQDGRTGLIQLERMYVPPGQGKPVPIRVDSDIDFIDDEPA